MDRVESELSQKRKQYAGNDTRQKTMMKTCGTIKQQIDNLNAEIGSLGSINGENKKLWLFAGSLRAIKKDYSSKQSELAMKQRTVEQLLAPKCDLEKEKKIIRLDKQVNDNVSVK